MTAQDLTGLTFREITREVRAALKNNCGNPYVKWGQGEFQRIIGLTYNKGCVWLSLMNGGKEMLTSAHKVVIQ